MIEGEKDEKGENNLLSLYAILSYVIMLVKCIIVCYVLIMLYMFSYVLNVFWIHALRGASVKGELTGSMIFAMIMLFLWLIACCESCVVNIKKGEIVGIRCFDVPIM